MCAPEDPIVIRIGATTVSAILVMLVATLTWALSAHFGF
jgi:hypothetical protein